MNDVAVDEGETLIFRPTLDVAATAAIKVIYELQHWSSSPDDFEDGLAENTQYVVNFAKGVIEGSTIALDSFDDMALERYGYFTLSVVDYSGPVALTREFVVGTLQNDDEVAGGDGDPAMFAQMKI
jgi:hypothetical protein